MASRTAAKNKWIAQNLDRINLTVPKGQKELIQSHADAHGESLNRFINRAIREAMERDRLVDDRKDDVTEHASSCNMSIGDDELKKLAVAFAALESVIPDIERIYFSRLPQTREHRANKISMEKLEPPPLSKGTLK